ncbi:TetR/AcrR family transcriptional regulator [Streptomyces sp. NPDC087659]|uniref:TetR/AcrR family transcriptional regulator n=1 Tax=Streptomyces sp. NPDC087659 TaxID=3365801 RepID=UPI003802DEF2
MRTYDGMTAEQRVAERRERIMNAGLDLFAAQGYAQTSIRAILRHAGLQDRYFAESFTSMDDLMAALLKRIYHQEIEVSQAAIAGEGKRREKARAMLEELTRILSADPRMGKVKLVESLGAGPLSSSARLEGMVNTSKIVAGLLRDVRATPEANITALSLAIVGGVNEMLLHWVNGDLPVSREELVEQGLFLFEAVARSASAT